MLVSRIVGSKYLGPVKFGEKRVKAISCLYRGVSNPSVCREGESRW